MKTFFESMKKFRVLWILVLVFAILVFVANETRLSREKIVYPESLDMIVATVQGKDITLRDFAVYVAHQEAAVQDQALAYDLDDTRKYWNIRTDMGFVNQVARNEAMSMAIHDELFYQLYQELNMEFSEEELALIQNNTEDFWLDLVDEERDVRLGIEKKDVYNTMYKIACSQKAQLVYAGILAVDDEDLDYASQEFLDFLSDYEYEVNDKVLNRLDFGDITLTHE
ncbi:MAG: SurA N-terminal domain-containing protein [Agathobacter sp.]|nr:SurA N-terminal domain-containing protein [Agathobacter sp.]